MQEEGLLTARSINILGTFLVLKKKKKDWTAFYYASGVAFIYLLDY